VEEPIQETRQASLRDFLAVLFRRKGVVLGIFVASLGVVLLINARSPVQYESVSQVLVSRGQPESAFNSGTRVVLSWEEELNSEIETARSSHIVQMAQKILDDGGVRDSEGRAVKINADNITTETISKSSVLYLRARDRDRMAAQEITRAMTQAYTNFRLSVRTVPELEAYFREEIESVKDQLEDWEQRRADYMNEESVSGIPEERRSLFNVRQEVEIALNDVRGGLAEEQARVEVLQNLMSRIQEDPAVEPYIFSEADNRDDEGVSKVKAQYLDKRAEYVTARAQYTDNHPLVQSLKEQVDTLRVYLGVEVENFLAYRRARVEVLKAREEAVLSSLSYIDSELGSYPSKEARIAAFDRVIEGLKTDYSALIQKQIDARMERIGTSNWNVLVLQPASEAKPIRVHDFVRLALIPIVGLLVATAMAFLVDGLDHSVKDATEAEQHLGLPVLGSVGKLR
jgi:polysaccharide biosynthesis transport protein